MIDGALHRRLVAIVGADHVLVDPELRAGYETDWTRRYRGQASAVVRPADMAETAAVIRACRSFRVPVVPQGGNTGTVGGGVPRTDDQVVLSLRRLDEIGPVDPMASQVEVGAGATLSGVQRAARAAGLDFGVDLPAREAATIGGMIATNAGGIGVFRYGSMRRQVLGLEAVLGDGSVVQRLAGLEKDNTGYDLAGLISGSEGTLAVVTRARLRLIPQLPERCTAMIAMPTLEDCLAMGRGLVGMLPSMVAVEFMSDTAMDVVREHLGLASPTERDSWYLLVEAAGRRPVASELTDALVELGAGDASLGTDAQVRDGLWRYRDGLPEALNAETVPIKLDVSLPLARLAEFCRRAPAVAQEVLRDARVALFGHLLDGNVHVNINHPGVDPGSDHELVDRIERAVLALVIALGGSISAEHGIGVAKARFLPSGRADADLAAMRAVKAALDPDGILNPGVIFA